MDTKRIVNVSLGYDVANAMDLYVNAFGDPGKRFSAFMRERSIRVQHNFTMLCLEWFKALAKVDHYDERNQASVEFAKKLSAVLKYDQLSMHKLSARGIEEEFIFDFRDDKSAVELMERYLRMAKDNELFINRMLNNHRTIQQNFSRLCCSWFGAIADMPARNKPYVVLARKTYANYKGFPMI